MPLVIACMLPHGLSVVHAGRTININGANVDADPLNPQPLGNANETANTVAGYGLTQLGDDDAKAFEDWSNHALYRVQDGKAAEGNGKLDEPFLPLTNGSIQTFKSMNEARDKLRRPDSVTTGFEGLDGDAEVKKAAAGSQLVDAGTDKAAKR